MFKYQIKFKVGKQRKWRDGCRMCDLEAAKKHASNLRGQLAKDYRTHEANIKMAVMENDQLICEV